MRAAGADRATPLSSSFLFTAALALAAGVAAGAAAGQAGAGEPIRLHPDNPRYFLFRGRPAVLITSGEHYGAVLNLDFDYVRYLDELKAHGFNLTRTFSGTYREVKGSFGITGNTLAPAPGRFICPWAAGEKFNLGAWNQAYFDRLKDFVGEAGRRGIVVELVLFCTMYDEAVWEASPMNARNNVEGIGRVGRYEVYDGRDPALLAAQEKLAGKIAAELNAFDNVYFEVCNEPYERGGLTKEWNDRIVAAIRLAERSLPNRHLIAQGFPPVDAPIADLNPGVSVLNFHAALPRSVQLNSKWNRVIAFDETGGSDQSDRKYRGDGWEFILAGGGVYDHLDFSFMTDDEEGKAVSLPPGTPGGGGPALRKQLRVLKEFIEGFEFVKMAPYESVRARISAAPGSKLAAAPGSKLAVRALAEPGEAYGVYVRISAPPTEYWRVELSLDLPAGKYRAEWVDPKRGEVTAAETFDHAGGEKTSVSPNSSEDVAFRLKRMR